MLGQFPFPFLSVAEDAVRDLEGEAAVLCLWNVFTKCKDSLPEGQRLENISWRLWHREMSAHHTSSSIPSSATTPSSETEMPALISPSPSPVSAGSSEESNPKDLSSALFSPPLTSIHSVSSTDTLCSARSRYHIAAGRIIFDQIIPDKIFISLSKKRPTLSRVDAQSPSPPPSTIVPTVQLPSTPPNIPCPRVVIVNPTPHPTPPATPLSTHHFSSQNSPSLQAPPTRPGHSVSPVRSLALTGIKTGDVPENPSLLKCQVPSSSGAFLRLRATSKPVVDDTLKLASGSVSHPKFFLKESPERDDSSPDREAGVRKGVGGEGSSQGGSSIAEKSVSSEKAASSLNSAKTSSLGSRAHAVRSKKTAAGAPAAVAPRRKGGHQIAVRPTRPTNNRMNSRFGQKKSRSSTNIAGAIAPSANMGVARTTSTRSEAKVPREDRDESLSPKLLSAPATSFHLPPPPQPALVRPTMTRKVSDRTKLVSQQQQQHRRGIVVDNSSTEYETTDSDDDSDWASEDATPAEDRARKRKAKKQAEEAKAKREEEEKELREKEMFAKLPRRSYTQLPAGASGVGGLLSGPGPRTRSVGLLSQLLNPDPTIFPPNHPYRTSFSTQDMTQFSRGGTFGLAVTRGSAATPLATQVTAHAPAQNGDIGANGKYRPRGRPEGAEMDDDSGEEDENKLELSTSLAQQRLAALASPDRRRSKLQEPSRQPASADRLPEHRAQSSRRPGLPTISTAPIPLSHPYNLPAPAPPSTPRTTRRQMLATELSESLRRNLLWERQISRVGDGGVPRRRNAGVLGLKPLTTMHVPPNTEAGASGSSGQEGTRSGDEPTNKTAGGESKEERRRKALARNRSWADDYHYAGW